MKHLIKNLTYFATVCALLLCLFVGTAVAGSSNETLEAEIPVDCIKFSRNRTENYIVKIESTDESYPAPKENKLTIKEDGTGYFVISINEPGNYDYLVYQEAGNDKDTMYDDTVYNVRVFVTQTDEKKLDFYVVATVKDTGEKPDRVEFENEDKNKIDGDSDSKTPPVKTGDESNIPAYAVLAGVMVVVFIILLVTRKKDDSDDEDDEK